MFLGILDSTYTSPISVQVLEINYLEAGMKTSLKQTAIQE